MIEQPSLFPHFIVIKSLLVNELHSFNNMLRLVKGSVALSEVHSHQGLLDRICAQVGFNWCSQSPLRL